MTKKEAAVIALLIVASLSMAGCVATQDAPYGPNVVPIDTTGNYGAR